MNLLLFIIVILLVLILARCLATPHCSKMMILPAVIINVLICLRLSNNFPWWKSLLMWTFLMVLELFYWLFLARKISYDFTKMVLSWTYIWNHMLNNLGKTVKGDGHVRVIGRVFPYNSNQMKWNGKAILFGETAAAGGMLIQGTVGSGKTFGILSMIRQNVDSGASLIFAEFKGDPKVVDEVKSLGNAHGYQVYTLDVNGADFNYDPLKNLNDTGRIEAIINMRKWSLDGGDAHYRTGVQLFLQKSLAQFRKTVWETKLKPQESCSYTLEYLKWLENYQPGRDEWDSYSTVVKLLELLLSGSLKNMFALKMNKVLDFHRIKNERFMVIISFVSSNKDQATSFSSLVFRDLLDEFTVEAPNRHIFLYVDEFGSLENPFIVKDILEKGRSAKIAPCLSLQDINQIVIQTNEAYLNSILGTVNTFIVYSGATRITAERLAGVQLAEIETVLMNLRKPVNGKGPTAIYISKYPSVNKRSNSEVYRFIPYIHHIKDVNDIKLKQQQQVYHAVLTDQEIVNSKNELKAILNGNLTDDELKTLNEVNNRQQVEAKKEIQNIPEQQHEGVKLSFGEINNQNIKNDLESLIFGDIKNE